MPLLGPDGLPIPPANPEEHVVPGTPTAIAMESAEPGGRATLALPPAALEALEAALPTLHEGYMETWRSYHPGLEGTLGTEEVYHRNRFKAYPTHTVALLAEAAGGLAAPVLLGVHLEEAIEADGGSTSGWDEASHWEVLEFRMTEAHPVVTTDEWWMDLKVRPYEEAP